MQVSGTPEHNSSWGIGGSTLEAGSHILRSTSLAQVSSLRTFCCNWRVPAVEDGHLFDAQRIPRGLVARAAGADAPSAPARSLSGSNCSTKFRRGGVPGGERRVELADADPLDRE